MPRPETNLLFLTKIFCLGGTVVLSPQIFKVPSSLLNLCEVLHASMWVSSGFSAFLLKVSQ